MTLSLFLVAPAGAQILYTEDGTPTSTAEEIRWLINRGRSNPAQENVTRGTSYTGLVARPPLAPSATLATSSRNHSEDLARTNSFQHETVTNSVFYNWSAHRNTAKSDFLERMADDGYGPLDSVTGAENLNAGVSNSDPIGIYLNWWGSTGHRNNMYDTNPPDSLRNREIGFGNHTSAASAYGSYNTLMLGRRPAYTGFFTDTLFRDANSNGAYSQGEGVSGVRVELRINGVSAAHYDVSSTVGSFAIPLNGISAGNVVGVYLVNTTGAAVNLSIPVNFQTNNPLTLAAGQTWLWGTFTRVAEQNAGFRNLTLATTQPISVPPLSMTMTGGNAVLSWPSQSGLTYQLQWSATLAPPWNNLGNPRPGTGSALTATDPVSGNSSGKRFYRLFITSP